MLHVYQEEDMLKPRYGEFTYPGLDMKPYAVTLYVLVVLATTVSSIGNINDDHICANITVSKVFLVVGEELTITCQGCEESPIDDVFLMKGSSTLAKQTHPNNSTVTFTISNITKDDSGSYQCCVKNCSSLTNDCRKQWIAVAAPPTLECVSINTDTMNCAWDNDWDTSDTNMSSQWNLSFTRSLRFGCSSTTYTKHPVPVQDDMCYRTGSRWSCKITNTYFGFQYKFQLTMTTRYGTLTFYFPVCYDYHIVKLIPSHPASYGNVLPTSVDLHWKMSMMGFPEGTACYITYQSEWGVHFNKTLVYRDKGHPRLKKHYTLTNLHPYTRYTAQIRCFVVGSVYHGEAMTLTFTTRESVPLSGPNMTNTSYVKYQFSDNDSSLLIYIKPPSRYYAQGEITKYIINQDELEDEFPVTTTIEYRWVKNVSIDVWESNKVGETYTTLDTPARNQYPSVIEYVTVEILPSNQFLVTCKTKPEGRTNLIYHYCEGHRFRNDANIINCTTDYNFIRSNRSHMTITTKSRDVYFAVSADNPDPSDGLRWQDCLYTFNTTGVQRIPRALEVQAKGVNTVKLLMGGQNCDGTQPKPYRFVMYWTVTGNRNDADTRHKDMSPVDNVQFMLTGLEANTNYSVWYQVIYRDNTKSENSSVLIFVTLDHDTDAKDDNTNTLIVLAVMIACSILILTALGGWKVHRYCKTPIAIEDPNISTTDKIKKEGHKDDKKTSRYTADSMKKYSTTAKIPSVQPKKTPVKIIWNIAHNDDYSRVTVGQSFVTPGDTEVNSRFVDDTEVNSRLVEYAEENTWVAVDTEEKNRDVVDDYVHTTDQLLTQSARSIVCGDKGLTGNSLQEYMKAELCDSDQMTSTLPSSNEVCSAPGLPCVNLDENPISSRQAVDLPTVSCNPIYQLSSNENETIWSPISLGVNNDYIGLSQLATCAWQSEGGFSDNSNRNGIATIGDGQIVTNPNSDYQTLPTVMLTPNAWIYEDKHLPSSVISKDTDEDLKQIHPFATTMTSRQQSDNDPSILVCENTTNNNLSGKQDTISMAHIHTIFDNNCSIVYSNNNSKMRDIPTENATYNALNETQTTSYIQFPMDMTSTASATSNETRCSYNASTESADDISPYLPHSHINITNNNVTESSRNCAEGYIFLPDVNSIHGL